MCFYSVCKVCAAGDRWFVGVGREASCVPTNKKGLPFQVSLMWYRNVHSDTNTPRSLPLKARMMMGVDVMNREHNHFFLLSKGK